MSRVKVLTILGTRPEIIRLSEIIKKLDKLCDHKVLYVGQSYSKELKDVFFKDLDLRLPDFDFSAEWCTTVGEQIGFYFQKTEKILDLVKPDKVLILGDTNSSLASLICERKGYPVYHMEAGNRCFDLNSPEEVNRKAIDHVCSYNLPYTEGSRQNLLSEGIHTSKIIKTGNPVYEVLNGPILQHTKRQGTIPNAEILVTIHRQENVDNIERFSSIIAALKEIATKVGVVYPCHPRALKRIKEFNIDCGDIQIKDPLGSKYFLGYAHQSKCLITDSGTVQEEGCILTKPTIVLRDSTERPETVECGASVLVGANKDLIIANVNRALTRWHYNWQIPEDYKVPNVSQIVVNILLGK